jgi:hypothetical protein
MEKTMTDLQKDLTREDTFKDATDKHFGMEDELSLLVKAYNEQLEALVKIRVDVEVSTRLMIMFPSDKANMETNVKSKDALVKREVIVDTIRSQIIEIVKWREEHKKPEVSV